LTTYIMDCGVNSMLINIVQNKILSVNYNSDCVAVYKLNQLQNVKPNKNMLEAVKTWLHL